MSEGLERRAALACAALGVLLLLTALAFILVDGGLSQRTAFVLPAGVALVIVDVLVDPGLVRALLRSPRSRRGSLGVLASAAVVGILVGANVLASRTYRAADLTRSGLYTLSPRSLLVTRQLDSDLVVTGFFRPDEQASRRAAQTLLDLYRQQSQRVKVRFADPDLDAGLARSLDAPAGSIVLQYRARSPVVLGVAQQNEPGVTAAILRLESTRTPTVCWAAGDGERDLKDADEVTGYTAAAELLRTSDYQVRDVLLAQQGVPRGCDVLVVLQLGRPLNDVGLGGIRDYLGRGGKLLLAVDPWTDPGILASANTLIQPYGAAFDGSLVIEPDPAHAAANDSTVPVVYSFGASPITRGLERRYVFFPAATPITGVGVAGDTSIVLAPTTDGAFAIARERTDLSRRAGDRAGPFALMRSVERRGAAGTTRIVLAGTSAVAENRTLPPATSSANPDLLLASLDWLSQQDALMAIAPKPPPAQPLSLSGRDAAVNVLLTVPLPILVVLAAGMVVRARRRST